MIKPLSEIYNTTTDAVKHGSNGKKIVLDDKNTGFNNEIEKNFNILFMQLKQVFPAITTLIKTQLDLDEFKNQWLLAFKENGIRRIEQFNAGMVIARKQNSPFVPSPGQFIAWCKEEQSSLLGLPTVNQVMKEFKRYNANRLDYQSAELFPWAYPIMYWIVTDLRKNMLQYNQSGLEVEKRAEYLLNQWVKKLSRGEKVPEIRVQIENKVATPYTSSFQCDHPLIKQMRKRIEAAKRRETNV